MTNLINRLTAFLVLCLAIVALALSYNALAEVALAYSSMGRLSIFWPVLIDGALIVFSLAVVRASLRGERPVWPWLMVGLFTIGTIAFNLIHSEAGLYYWLVAIVPPVALFLSFETLMAMLKGEVKYSEAVKSLSSVLAQKAEIEREMREFQREAVKRVEGEAQAKRQELDSQLSQVVNQLEAGRVELDTLTRQIQEAIETSQEAGQVEIDRQQEVINQLAEQVEVLQQTAKSYEEDIEARRQELAGMDNPVKIYVHIPDNFAIQERQALVKKMLADGLTQAQVAGALGVSESTVKNDKRAVVTNGNGRH